METNEIEVKKNKNSKSVVFKSIGGILYLVAFIMLVIGICKLIFEGVNQMQHMQELFSSDEFEIESDSYNFILGNLMGYFMRAIAFFVIGSIFTSIGKAIDAKEIQNKMNSKEYMPETGSENNDVQQKPEKKLEKVYCAYCGCELDVNQRKCPYCGASKKVQKKIDKD